MISRQLPAGNNDRVWTKLRDGVQIIFHQKTLQNYEETRRVCLLWALEGPKSTAIFKILY